MSVGLFGLHSHHQMEMQGALAVTTDIDNKHYAVIFAIYMTSFCTYMYLFLNK